MHTLGREPSMLQEALDRSRDPEILSLALGMPASELLPCRELAEASQLVLQEGPRSLQYGPAEQGIKDHIVGLMRQRGVECSHDEVFLTSGAQQGLALLGQLLLNDTNRGILVEETLYPGFRQAVEPLCPRLVAVPSDSSDGIDLEAAEFALQHQSKPSFLYTMSVGHNPLSRTMTESARVALINFSQRHSVPIVEDDVYGFLQYEDSPAPPLRSIDGGAVFYVGSFSKILAPALRVGWIVAPRACLATLAILKEGSDINTGTLAQRIVSSYLESNSISDRIEYLRSQYRLRRDAMQEALLKLRFGSVRWRKPSAGFFFWLKSEEFGDTAELLWRALNRRVAFLPGAAFCIANQAHYRHAMRLSFSHCPAGCIEQAVERVAQVVREQVESSCRGLDWART